MKPQARNLHANGSFGRDAMHWELAAKDQMHATKRTMRMAVESITNLMKIAPENSCASVKGPDYLQLLQECQPGIPITYAEYTKAMKSKRPVRGDYVLCTAGDARRVIAEFGPPRIPILVPPEWNVSLERTWDGQPVDPPEQEVFDKFFHWVKALDQPMDVNKPFADATGDYQLPEKMAPQDIEKLFNREAFDITTGPINLLEIRSRDDNPVSPCLAELSDFKLMRDLRSLPDVVDAKAKTKAADLSSSFQICGQKGVFSEPHIDHHGVTTTITVQAGEKLWPVYSNNSAEALERWILSHEEGSQSGSEDAMDIDEKPAEPVEKPKRQTDGSWKGIYCKRGTLLIQPPGTLHAPYSPSNVLCSGTMHIDTRGLLKSAELSDLELKYPNLTNEQPALEYPNCMIHAARMWKNHVGEYKWLPEKDRNRFLELLKVFLDDIQPPDCCVKPKKAAHDRSCKIPKLRKILQGEK